MQQYAAFHQGLYYFPKYPVYKKLIIYCIFMVFKERRLDWQNSVFRVGEASSEHSVSTYLQYWFRYEIWLRLFQGEHSLYIRFKMTSFVDSHVGVLGLKDGSKSVWIGALYMINSGTRYIPGLFCLLYPLDGVSTWRNMAARCTSVKIDIVLDWVGKHEDIIHWNDGAMMKGSLMVWALYAYFSDSQNAAFELLVWCM